MNNFNFTEKHKIELFENGCTFFDAVSTEIISNLNFWEKEIKNLDMSEGKCMNICPLDKERDDLSLGHQHWHVFSFEDMYKLSHKKNYKQYLEYITEVNDFFYDRPTLLDGAPGTNIQVSHYNDAFWEHRDGQGAGTAHASLLVYLNKNWKYEYGGELTVIGSDKKKYIHLPEFGSVALIDFSKGDPTHEIKKVKGLRVQRVVLSTFLNTENE